MDPEAISRHSETALAVLDTEYQRTETEIDALTEFYTQVADIDASRIRPDGGTRLTAPLKAFRRPTQPAGCTEVCQTYRETLMAIPHYEDEYGEPLQEHMAMELGHELAESVTSGEQLTPQLKQAILTASQQARADRRDFLTHLDAEADALREARTTLTEIRTELREYNARPLADYSFEELFDLYEFIEQSEARCEQVATNRQAALHADDWAGVGNADRVSLQAYLYDELEVTYPILADTATCCQLLHHAQTPIEQALATTA